MERWYFFLYKCPLCHTFYERTITLFENHIPNNGFTFSLYCQAPANKVPSKCGGTLELINVEVKVI